MVKNFKMEGKLLKTIRVLANQKVIFQYSITNHQSIYYDCNGQNTVVT